VKGRDAYLPAYELVERHSAHVAADRARVHRAVHELTLRDRPVAQAVILVRGLGAGRADEPVLDAMRRRGTVLEDVPGEGIVLSLHGRFWRWRGGGSEPAARAVVDFRVDAGTLTSETRVHVPDARSRRRFARYWRIVRPFSGLTRIAVLRAAKRRAERP